MTRPASNGPLRRLVIASLLWNGGEQVYLVGLVLFAYRVGGPAAVALLGILQAAPSVLLVERLLAIGEAIPTQRLLQALLAVRALALAAATATLAIDGPAWIVFVAAAIDALAASVVRPTRSGMAPRIARTTRELIASNVSISTGRSLATLIGPSIAAVLLATRSVTATFGLGAALLALAFGVALRVRASAPLPVTRSSAPMERIGGLAVLRRRPHAAAIVAVIAGQQLVRGMLPVLLVSLALETLRAGDQAVGIVNAAVGLGGLVGGALSLVVARRVRLSGAFAAGFGLWGTGLVVAGSVSSLAPVAVALAAGGIGKSALEVTGVTLLQRTVPSTERSAVFGTLERLATLAASIGAVAGAALVAGAGPGAALMVAGSLSILLAAVAWPVLRTADAVADVPEREARLLASVPMLEPLGLYTIEELATSARRITVAAGADVIREGDPGETFYVVEAGRLGVILEGETVRSLGPGDSFGEISLIRDVPRTATVRAIEPSGLLTIDRANFLAAVLGKQEAAAAAEDVIRGHLG